MNSEELKNLIESARVGKGISQRELAKLTGISRSTLNDLINEKIKKVDIDDLRKIPETLDMSLQKLLKVAGYDEMLFYFSKDKYANKSSKDLKEMIKKSGYIVFDDLYWSIGKSPTVNPEVNPGIKNLYTDEQINDYQVQRVVNAFMVNDKSFKQCYIDNYDRIVFQRII